MVSVCDMKTKLILSEVSVNNFKILETFRLSADTFCFDLIIFVLKNYFCCAQILIRRRISFLFVSNDFSDPRKTFRNQLKWSLASSAQHSNSVHRCPIFRLLRLLNAY